MRKGRSIIELLVLLKNVVKTKDTEGMCGAVRYMAGVDEHHEYAITYHEKERLDQHLFENRKITLYGYDAKNRLVITPINRGYSYKSLYWWSKSNKKVRINWIESEIRRLSDNI